MEQKIKLAASPWKHVIKGNTGCVFPDRRSLEIYDLNLGELELDLNEDLDTLSIVTNASGILRIYGNVGGYKSRISAPNLDVEIFGNVDGLGPFIYRAGEFNKMNISGDVNSNCLFAALTKGDLYVNGFAWNFDVEEAKNWTSCRFNSAKGNVWIEGKQVLREGELVY